VRAWRNRATGALVVGAAAIALTACSSALEDAVDEAAIREDALRAMQLHPPCTGKMSEEALEKCQQDIDAADRVSR
jgi:hypothetical protein